MLLRVTPHSLCWQKRIPFACPPRRSRSFLQTTPVTKVFHPQSILTLHGRTTYFSTSRSTMPQPPYPYRSSTMNNIQLDLSTVDSQIRIDDERRQRTMAVSRQLQVRLVQARAEMELESTTTEMMNQTLNDIMSSLARETTTITFQSPRHGHLSTRMEEFVRLMAFHHFLAHGTLIPPSQCGTMPSTTTPTSSSTTTTTSPSLIITDEEYLAGACMGLCYELARYAIGRATARDVTSVRCTRDLIQEILNYLLQFDFRNGPLRRKYDGTKYQLKTVETLLYELSVTGATVTDNEEPAMKVAKRELLDITELEALRIRMERRDDCRESLIKKSRDGQKTAKQAIYALHRGDHMGARRLLTQCENCITKDLLPIVLQEPQLRAGSFAHVVEEYVEAKLFYAWLNGPNNDDEDNQSSKVKPVGTILLPTDFGTMSLDMDEYLGGLCDLTGEIGRYGVQRGTARDFVAVKCCLATNTAIHLAIQTFERFPFGIGKKLDALGQSVEKLERMMYELSLSEATGRKMASNAIQEQPSMMDSTAGDAGGDP